MSADTPSVQAASDGGIAADHPVLKSHPALVAAARTDKEHNTIRTSIVPFACWRANDMRFEFESSFVLPGIAAEIGALKALIEKHTRTDDAGARHLPGLSVFGHADPTGNDDFNKLLSGRRAQAIYGLLTRRTDLWEDLFTHPLGNDKWDPKSTRVMQATLGLPVREHPSPAERKKLFTDYMDAICTVRGDNGGPERDAAGQPVRVQLKPEDFLAEGKDAQGKGDFQGCGEFNPILLVSDPDFKRFSDPKNKEERDARNLPNRRVLVLLFRPGAKINPSAWPCPRVKEGVGGCRKRFWSDGEKRRSSRLPDKVRRFEDNNDTMACRFYHRLVSASPCERELKSFQVRLYDAFGRTIPDAPFMVSIGGRAFTELSAADSQGIITLLDVRVPDTVVVRWGLKPEKDRTPDLGFERKLFLVADDEPKDQAVRKKLNNLGYDEDNEEDNITGFQLDYGDLANPPLEPTGELDAPTEKLLDRIYRESVGDLRETDLSNPERA